MLPEDFLFEHQIRARVDVGKRMIQLHVKPGRMPGAGQMEVLLPSFSIDRKASYVPKWASNITRYVWQQRREMDELILQMRKERCCYQKPQYHNMLVRPQYETPMQCSIHNQPENT